MVTVLVPPPFSVTVPLLSVLFTVVVAKVETPVTPKVVPTVTLVEKAPEVAPEIAPAFVIPPALLLSPPDTDAPPAVTVKPPASTVTAPVAVVTFNCFAEVPKARLPVEVPPMVMVPAPLASTVRFSSVPEETTDTAKPAAAAADLTFKPVTDEAVEASTCRAGLSEPPAPTVNALALVEVTVKALDTPVMAGLNVPVTVRLPVTVVVANPVVPVEVRVVKAPVDGVVPPTGVEFIPGVTASPSAVENLATYTPDAATPNSVELDLYKPILVCPVNV